MRKLILVLFVFLISTSLINSLCEEGQININFASFEKLKTFTGIGDAKAQKIIDARPFNSLEDILEIYRIGDETLKNLKNENACVDDKNEQETKEIDKKETLEFKEPEKENLSLIKEKPKENILLKPINLNPKVIKTKNDKQELNKSDYAKYGFVGFCILLGILFMFKKNKNEFR